MSAVVPLASKGISQITEKWRPKPKLHHSLSKLSPNFLHSSCSPSRPFSPLTPKASVSSADYVVEPATSELTVPGCSGSLVLLGTVSSDVCKRRLSKEGMQEADQISSHDLLKSSDVNKGSTKNEGKENKRA